MLDPKLFTESSNVDMVYMLHLVQHLIDLLGGLFFEHLLHFFQIGFGGGDLRKTPVLN